MNIYNNFLSVTGDGGLEAFWCNVLMCFDAITNSHFDYVKTIML